MSEIKFRDLDGKGVLTQDGREIGEVSDCVLDHVEWSVLTLVVKLERDLLEQFHMKRPMFGTQTIQLPTHYVSGVSDKVILHKKLEDLTAIAREKAAIEAGASHPSAKDAPAKDASAKGTSAKDASSNDASSNDASSNDEAQK